MSRCLSRLTQWNCLTQLNSGVLDIRDSVLPERRIRGTGRGAVVNRVNVLLECHIAREETKQGFTPEEALAVLTGEARWPHIRFCGLMGMATNTDDESVIRSDFSKLLALNASLQPMVGICPNLTQDFRELSFGMSDDYKIAASMGATIVRIGTAIFGVRR